MVEKNSEIILGYWGGCNQVTHIPDQPSSWCPESYFINCIESKKPLWVNITLLLRISITTHIAYRNSSHDRAPRIHHNLSNWSKYSPIRFHSSVIYVFTTLTSSISLFPSYSYSFSHTQLLIFLLINIIIFTIAINLAYYIFDRAVYWHRTQESSFEIFIRIAQAVENMPFALFWRKSRRK